ncbi:MAG: cation-transporting P-type ATPase, partial [Proteobacteria bacterium]|nr:cation-transporting P-type ATPase [Pseudomonadota bacterium]
MHLILPKTVLAARPVDRSKIRVSPLLVETAALEPAVVFERLATRPDGLTADEAATRLAQHGPNVLVHDRRPNVTTLLGRALINPLVILLAVLAIVSFATGDPRAGTMMVLMIVLSVGLKLFQEGRAATSADKLKAMISVHATVVRDGQPCELP